MTTRRELLSVLGFGALACALPLHSQTPPPRVVWISPVAENIGAPFFAEFRDGMKGLGYVEGKTIALSVRYGDGSAATTTKLITDAVESRPAVLVAQGSAGPLVRKLNPVLPVVFGYSGDPVMAGMVDSFARPGGNMTGISYMKTELIGKRMEMLKELIPAARRVAVVASPSHPGDASERRATQDAAAKLGVALEYFELRSEAAMPEVLAAVEKSRSNAAMFFPTQSIIATRQSIATWAEKNRLPAISGWASFAEGGNVMSYGPNLNETSRRLAFYVDRILKGAKPAELPVELPNRVEFVVNQKAARAIGLSVPRALLVRADRVIEQ